MRIDPISFRPTEADATQIETIKAYLDSQHRPPGSDEWTTGRIIRWALHCKAGDLSGYAADAKPPRPAAAVPVPAPPKRRTAPKGQS
jgi:hypothetical protein